VVLVRNAAPADRTPVATVASSAPPSQEFAVTDTFDGVPFRYQIKLAATRRGYRIYRITYPSPMVTPVAQNNTVPADYYLPDGIGRESEPRPAVICLHILGGNFELVRILCASLASRGIPAVMFKLPYYGERAMPGGERAMARDVGRFAEAMGQAFLDVRRTFDMLAARPEVDPGRIGIAGISLGGIVSASAAGGEPRLHRAALLLAGGDLLSIIHQARETDELSRTLRNLPDAQRVAIEGAILAADPLTRAPGLRQRALAGKVLMVNATEDEVVPPAATRKLAAALGMTGRVEWLEGLGHYTAMARLPEVVRKTVDFFAADLPDGANRPEVTAPGATGGSPGADPLLQVANLIAQAASMFSSPIDVGGGKHLALHADITDQQGTSHQGELQLTRGADHRFRLQWRVPVLGEAVIGQGKYPWMATPATLFRGTGAGGGPAGSNACDPLAFAKPDDLARVRMVAGALTTLPLAPRILEELIQVDYEPAAGHPSAIHILPRQKANPDDLVRVLLAEDGVTPREITFHLAGLQGRVTIDAWQPRAACSDESFQPPANLAVQDVTRANVYRLFATLFHSALRWAE